MDTIDLDNVADNSGDDENGDNDNDNDNTDNGGSGGQQQQRDRNRRGRGSRFSDANNDNNSSRDRSRQRGGGSGGVCKRVYVSNIPYEYRWQELKDLFRRIVGTVDFVELFMDENNKPRGCGIVEFKDPDSVQKCVEKMNRYELQGREIVVKEDHGEERDKYGRFGGGGGGGGGNSQRGGSNRGGNRDNSGGGGGHRDRDNDRSFMMNRGGGDLSGKVGGGGNFNMPRENFNTYGLSTSFLANLGIDGPLHTKIFVANLDYKANAKKLKEVFKMAGRIVNVDLATDKDGNSRGFAVVDYEHPVEAVQAISMFDRQSLFERRMTVRLDRLPNKNEKVNLPEGLGGIGMGLGPNGEPLRNVAANLPNSNSNNSGNCGNNSMNMNSQSNMTNQSSMLGQQSVPAPVAPPNNGANLLGSVPNTTQQLSDNVAMALNSVLGNVSNLSALSNPLLTSAAAAVGLNKLGINLGNAGVSAGGGGGGGVGDLGSNTSNPNFVTGMGMGGNQQQGNSYSTGVGGNYGGGTGFSSQNRHNDFDSGSLRSFNSTQQAQDDFNRLSSSFNSNLSQVLSQQLGTNAGKTSMGSDTILIRNLPSSYTWQNLRDKFRDIGEVKFAEIRGQDCGVVRFSKERDAEFAIKIMDGARFDDRIVAVTFM